MENLDSLVKSRGRLAWVKGVFSATITAVSSVDPAKCPATAAVFDFASSKRIWSMENWLSGGSW